MAYARGGEEPCHRAPAQPIRLVQSFHRPQHKIHRVRDLRNGNKEVSNKPANSPNVDIIMLT